MVAKKRARRQRIRYAIRNKISGTAQRPRMAIFRSNKAIYVQLIDDLNGHTLAAASSRGLTGSNIELAKAVGQKIADMAKGASIESVVFDRGGYLYHGRVKALADGARENGLKF